SIALGLKSVKEFPAEVQVWNELGIAYMEDGQKVEAARIFTKATEVGAMSADTVYPYYNLGRLASETSDDKVAIAYLRKALACNPTHGWAHQYLAKALERQGQKAEAIAEYRAAIKAKPGFTEARDALSRLGAHP
ncbi:MAG: tetratricopeptide repeat protein, partial [Candidatus Sericytochromatia bacterium]